MQTQPLERMRNAIMEDKVKDESILIYEQRIGITIDALADEIKKITVDVAKNPLVTFRVKDGEKLRKKMKLEKVEDIFLIDDVYGIRIIVESIEEVYAVLAKVSQTFQGKLDHDYFQKIKPVPVVNGKVLRLLQFIACKNGVTFEIQVTTALCHSVNELLHEGYHRKKYHS